MKVTIDNVRVEMTTFGNELVWAEIGTMNILGKVTDLKDKVQYDYSEERIALGKALKDARLKKGLTMDKLVELTGFSKSAINSYEKGKYSPTTDSLIRLEYFLDTQFLRF